jgi:hypothetical protein
VKITEKDFLQAVERADRRYFDMVTRRIERHRSETAARKGQRLMKQRETRGKIGRIGKIAAAGLIAAAVLGAGGMAAIVAMRGTQGGSIFQRNTVGVKLKNITEGVDTPALRLTEGGDDDFTARLMPEQDYYIADSLRGISVNPYVTETENGWFFRRRDKYAPPEEQTEITADYFCYKDKATGETVPLCARANCLHDGNEYCEASTKAYETHHLLSWDGGLYTVAEKGRGADSKGCFLLSYAPDGTGIEELVQFTSDLPNAQIAVQDFCIHKGYLFAALSVAEQAVTEQPDVGTVTKAVRGGWAVVCYDFAEKQAYTLYLNLPPEGEHTVYGSPEQIWCKGSALYALETGTHSGIYRMDLGTFACERLEENVRLYAGDFFAGTDGIYYRDDAGIEPAYKCCDYETGEITKGMRQKLGDAGEAFPFVLKQGEYTFWQWSDYGEDTHAHGIAVGDAAGRTLARIDLTSRGKILRYFVRDGYLWFVTDGFDLRYDTIYEDGLIREGDFNPDADANACLCRIPTADVLRGDTDASDCETVLTLSEVSLK